jgi:AcrR family transcriptional regulator
VDEGERPLGLRERKKLETRQALADAAIKLAVERGLENVTVEDIAARAGVSQRTFFNYFPSKEDAVLRPDADPIAMAQVIIDRLNGIPADVHPLRAIAAAFRPVAERIDHEAREWLVRVSIVENDPALLVKMFTAQKETERMVHEAIAARVGVDPDTDIYPELVYQTVGAAFRAATHRWYIRGGSVSVTSLFDAAVDQIAAGLPQPENTPEGEKK